MKSGLLATSCSILLLVTAGNSAKATQSYMVTAQPGFTAIANQLDAGGNTLQEVFPNPTGTLNGNEIYKYNCSGDPGQAGSYSIYIFDSSRATGFRDPNGNTVTTTLVPGEGAFFRNVTGGNIVLTFTGEPHVPVLPIYLPCGCGQYNFISGQTTNASQVFEEFMGIEPVGGECFYGWTGFVWQPNCFDEFGAGWDAGDPVLALGESALVKLVPCSATPQMTCATNRTVDGCSPWDFTPPGNIFVSCYSNYTLTVTTVTNSGPCPLVLTRTWVILDICGDTNSCSETLTVQCCNPCPTNPLALFNTGVDDNGVVLTNGQVDPHYVLTVNTNNTGTNAVAVNTPLVAGWLTNSSTSRWIGPTASGDGSQGGYVYHLSFGVPCTNNAVITGRWAVDNDGYVLLNGNPSLIPPLTGGVPGNFSTWHSFSINSGLVAGQNTLDFVVTNSTTGKTGLRVELSGTATCCCPPTNTIILNTGYNHPQSAVYPIGAPDAFWTVLSDPDTGSYEPRQATVIAKYPSGWADPQPSSQWISSYANAVDDLNGAYDFQTHFCLQTNWTNIVLSFCFRADDWAEVFLNGTANANRIFTGPFPGFRTSDLVCGSLSDQSKFVTGANLLLVRVHNKQNVAMGLNLTGTVTGSGVALDKPECCQPWASLSGRKFNDLNGDGVIDPGEPVLIGWTIYLSDGQTTTTDANGYYYFNNLPPGTYTVTEAQQNGWLQTTPAGGYTVSLGTAQATNDLNFANHYSETNCVQLECPTTNIVVECAGPGGTPVPFTVNATSSCGSVTVVCTPPSPGPFGVGVTTVHCVATDILGNTASCDFRVKVLDESPPAITCPTNIVVESCTNLPVYYTVTATDDCCSNAVTVTCAPPSGSIFTPGTTNPVHCLATDCNGNTNSCDFTVTVLARQSITIFNTGVTNNGSLLANGAVDPHYTLTTNPNGGGSAAFAGDPIPGSWLANSTASRWIGPVANGQTSVNPGTYVYHLSFTLPCTNNILITGRWAADNAGFIQVNQTSTHLGTLTGSDPLNFSTWHSFTVPPGLLVQGQNALDFYVTNTTTSATPSGLRAELSAKVDCCCTPPPTNMAAWWPLDETSGTNALEIIAANNGVATPGVIGSGTGPAPVAGEVSGALYFNNSDYLTVPSAPALNPGAGDLTIDAWVNVPNPGHVYLHPVAHKFDWNQTKGYYLALHSAFGSGAQLRFVIGGGGSLAQYYSSSTPAIVPYGVWTHVAVTVNRSASAVTFYINGIAKTLTSPSIPASSIDNAAPLLIGASSEPGLTLRPISIDELELFKRALTPQEIQALVNTGAGGKCKCACGQPTAPQLSYTRVGSTIILTWPACCLQEADKVTGPYTVISGATSPYTVPTLSSQKYYRLRCN